MGANSVRRSAGDLVLGVALTLLVAQNVPAQEPTPPRTIIDRIVALVGSEAILLSEVEEETFLEATRSGIDLSDPDSAKVARDRAFEGLLEARVLLAKAHSEGLRASTEEVERAVQAMVGDLQARFPSEDAFRAQLARENMTIEKLEATYRARMRDQLDIGKLIERDVRGKIEISDAEVRAYYDAHRAEIPSLPASLELRRIRVGLRSAGSADSASIDRADIVRRRLLAGEDFATLASVFSEGPDAAKGGDLGWFRQGDLEPALEEAVAELEPGEISDIVSSSRGTHLLRLEERDGERFHLRQIVFLRDAAAVKAAARARAESLRRRVESGEDFVEVAKAESDEPGDPEQRGRAVKVPIESLEPALRTVLEKLEPGQISEVIEGPEGLSFFRLESRDGEREATFDEIRDRLENLLRQEKTEAGYDEYVAKVRAETFVEILPEPGS